MKAMFFFLSPFALEQKLIIVDDEDRDYYEEKDFSISNIEEVGLAALKEYNIKKVIFKGPTDYAKKFYKEFKQKAQENQYELDFELKE